MLTPSFSTGFGISFSLIAAIGIQNVFVLKQGLSKHHVLLTVLTCVLCDFFLTLLGVLGLGQWIKAMPLIETVLLAGGMVFLAWYALKNIKLALYPQQIDASITEQERPLDGKDVIVKAMGFSLLNPHALLDTVILIGGASLKFVLLPEKATFLMGSLLASLIWFMALGFGAKRFSTLFQKEWTWRILNFSTGAWMASIAAGLAQKLLSI